MPMVRIILLSVYEDMSSRFKKNDICRPVPGVNSSVGILLALAFVECVCYSVLLVPIRSWVMAELWSLFRKYISTPICWTSLCTRLPVHGNMKPCLIDANFEIYPILYNKSYRMSIPHTVSQRICLLYITRKLKLIVQHNDLEGKGCYSLRSWVMVLQDVWPF